MAQRLVVVGGDAAGMSAASQVVRRRPDVRVLAFERGRSTSYSACGIPYWVGGAVGSEAELVSRTPEQHRANGIDVRTRTEVTAVDLDRRTATWRDLQTGETGSEGFDSLLLATGSTPVRPPVPGIDAAGVHGVQTLDDGAALRAELDGGGVRRVVVVGGGYIGLEVAEACAVRGLAVTVVTRSAAPLGALEPEVGAAVAEAVRGEGIELLLDEEVVEVEVGRDGRAAGVRTAGGTRLPADLVVLGLGVRPQVSLARAAGVPVGEAGGVAVDERMRTGVDGVWAAGDCVQSHHRVSGRQVVVALGTHANKQGRVAGIDIAGGSAAFPGVVGTAITKVCRLEVARTGLSRAEAEEAGFACAVTSIDATTTAGYMPGAQPVRVTAVVEEGSGRLLGAQVVGREGAAKRIDVLAVCVWHAMAVEDVMSLDLAYAPPFSPVWDPVLVAARRAASDVADVGERRG